MSILTFFSALCSCSDSFCVYVMLLCLCKGVHHSQSVKSDLWDAASRSLLFLLLYASIPTCLLWIHLLMPHNCTWSFLLSLCTGLFICSHPLNCCDLRFCPSLILSQGLACSLSYLPDASVNDAVALLLPFSFAWTLYITAEPTWAEQECIASS